ncbi:MAG: GNAT family N-acetyltransferase [Ignavibacteria bacterium]
MNGKYVVRNAALHELSIFTDYARKEGWNPGLNDIMSFWESDNRGFFVGLLDNTPIATISCVKYDDNFAFMGFYIVRSEYREHGYGIKIWDNALEYACDINIGLDGVLAQQQNYERSGFKLAYKNIRFEGLNNVVSGFDKTVDFDESLFDELNSYDNKHFLSDRRGFLKVWFKNAKAVKVKLHGSKATGFGVIRECFSGYKIGPVFADDKNTAEAIITDLLKSIPIGEKFYLDVPAVNKRAIRICEKMYMKKVFETVRMYNKYIPDVPVNNVFGVTTFELG